MLFFFFTLIWCCRDQERVCLSKKKMAPKKSVASKRPRGSSSSDYDRTQFVSVDAEGRFIASVTKQSGIKEWGFEIDVENARVEGFQRVIQNHR